MKILRFSDALSLTFSENAEMAPAALAPDVQRLTFSIHEALTRRDYNEVMRLIRLRDAEYDRLSYDERERYRAWAHLRIEALPGGDPFCVPHLIDLVESLLSN